MYAHLVDNAILRLSPTPPPVQEHKQKLLDIRPGQHDPEDAGWYKVIETPKPEDTATHKYESEIVVNEDGRPIRQWIEILLTDEEIRNRFESKAAIHDLLRRVELLERAVFPPDPEPTQPLPDGGKTFEEYGGIWPPDKLLRDQNGKIYRNVSRVPLSSQPSEFPGDLNLWDHLFVLVEVPGEIVEPPAYDDWVQPQGSHDAYRKDAHVWHKGSLWRNDVDYNSYEPGVYGWVLAQVIE